jgi:hypothetical protein
MKPMRQPWIYSPGFDGGFILAPALIITLLALCFGQQLTASPGIPTWLWGVLIIGVDVGHVYATLFRTYADPKEWQARKELYLLIPFLCWVVGTMLYSIDAIWFWRAIAYLAVYHFVRQQYGFMMIYARQEQAPRWQRRLDQATIYSATLYPLIYWHTHLPRQFDWFIAGDFAALPWPLLHDGALVLYCLCLIAYGFKELQQFFRQRTFNAPKNLLVLGTCVSWFVGIITFNNDLVFTAINVVAHGIPYSALIWIYCRNREQNAPAARSARRQIWRQLFTLRMIPLYCGILVACGYLEEGLWDGLVWRDHGHLFAPFQFLPKIDDKLMLAWLVPLLALPQMTHYVLDAYIWRLKKNHAEWKAILFPSGLGAIKNR